MLACRSVHMRVQRCTYAVRAFSSPRKIHDRDEIAGIDFGTTNSHLAFMEAQVPTLLETLETEGGKAISSFVAIDSMKEILFGQVAKCHALAYPADGLFHIKSLLGRNFHDSIVQELRTKVPFKIIEGSNGEAWIEACNEHFSPTKVCAIIIAHIKNLAKSYHMLSISKAVIAAPIYFSNDQKKELEMAGKIAGLEVLGVIDEPIAAASLSLKDRDSGTFAIFCLGGGIFNISIVEICDEVIQVKAKEFDMSLRGEDFDIVLVEYLAEEIRKVHFVDIFGDRVAMMRLKDAAQKAKLELSSSNQTTVDVPYLTGSQHGLLHVNITLTRSKFEELVEHLIDRIRQLCRKCLEAGHVNAQSIKEIILVGGMTKIPRVQQTVEEIFMKSPSMLVDPEEVVAIGALLQCALIVENGRRLLPDLIPLSLGIETLGGEFTRVIHRGCVIPCKGTHSISTSFDSQDSISIRILQGEHVVASNNILLRQLTMTGIPRAPQGVISVNVNFSVDTNGVLNVLVKSKDTDTELSAADIHYLDQIGETCERRRAMAKDAITFGRRNMEKFSLMQLRRTGEFRINRIEKMLNLSRKNLPGGVLSYWEGELASYKKAMDLENVLSLKSTISAAAFLEYEIGTYVPYDPDLYDEKL